METDPRGTVLSDARPLHPKEDVIPTLIFEGSHPIQAVGEHPHPSSGAVIFSSETSGLSPDRTRS